eukprot:CAMPEP_0197029754 /NCGR_PEP_ID=MMETSP1384-20130603/9138_1 /TAXON_ID=29189 /ORGANISM="Ammonia sp." /LENGTH=262 /DNA_ID=CAMNT_0042458981 /DNA_START=34 /DNA_END=823 /DNA_ORIENTATION=-
MAQEAAPSSNNNNNNNDTFSVDREKTTPFLIRVFVHRGRHFTDDDFRDPTNLPHGRSGQIYIHTWLDATLLELTKLLGRVVPVLKNPHSDSQLSFALVYPDRKGRMVVKECGKLNHFDINKSPSSHSEFHNKTLKDLKFEIGDLLDVAINPVVSSNNHHRHVHHHHESSSSSYRGRGGASASSSYSAMNSRSEHEPSNSYGDIKALSGGEEEEDVVEAEEADTEEEEEEEEVVMEWKEGRFIRIHDISSEIRMMTIMLHHCE